MQQHSRIVRTLENVAKYIRLHTRCRIGQDEYFIDQKFMEEPSTIERITSIYMEKCRETRGCYKYCYF